MTRISVATLLTGLSAIAGNTSSTPATFNKDARPILQKNCQGGHRDGQIGAMPFLTYQDTRPWAEAIKAAELTNKMSPSFADARNGHFANERKLGTGEIDTFANWASTGESDTALKCRTTASTGSSATTKRRLR